MLISRLVDTGIRTVCAVPERYGRSVCVFDLGRNGGNGGVGRLDFLVVSGMLKMERDQW